jgi:hypothetical protein
VQQSTDSNPPMHRPAAPTPCLLLPPQQVAARCCHSHQSRVRHRASCGRRYPSHVRAGGALPFPRRLGSGHRPPCVGTGRATTRVPARAARHHQSYLDRQRLDLRSANCPWDRIFCPWLQQRTKGWGREPVVSRTAGGTAGGGGGSAPRSLRCGVCHWPVAGVQQRSSRCMHPRSPPGFGGSILLIPLLRRSTLGHTSCWLPAGSGSQNLAVG